MSTDNRQLIGLVVILFGIVLLLDNFGIIQSFDIGHLISTYWPLFLIGLGLSAFSNKNRKMGMFIIFVGLIFQISELFDVSAWGIIWPLGIMFIGFSVLRGKSPSSHTSSGTYSKDKLNEFTLFWGNEKRVQSNSFTGGTVSTIFGSTEIDLRDVHIAGNEAHISVTCVFGSVELMVDPNKYHVHVSGTPVLASWENHYQAVEGDKPTLHISGSAVFGSVEVKS